jgi:hypothetical protein
MSGSIIRSSDLIAARIRAVRMSAFWASSPARCSRRSWDPPGSGHKPPRTGIPGQSAHVHHRDWHQRVVPVTIGVPDSPLIRPARPLGYYCGENGGSWRRRYRRMSGWRTAAGFALMLSSRRTMTASVTPRRRVPRVRTSGPGSLTVRIGLISIRCEIASPAEAITPGGGTWPGPGLLDQLAASPATVSGTPPNSPAGVSWPPWPTAQPNSFCASGWIAYR